MTDSSLSQIVAIDGATGYVGSHLVHALTKRGTEVRAIVRPGARADDCQFLESCGAKVFKTDLKAGSTVLADALREAACMVHLIGSIAPPKGQKLADLHGGQTHELIEACRSSQNKVLMVTALGTSAEAESEYHRTKWQAEEMLRKSGLPFVILRPSLIVGRQVGRRDSKLMARYIELINTRPRVPLVGGGKNKIQPVFIGDLVNAIMTATAQDKFSGQTLEIGGLEVLSMHDLVEQLMSVLDIKKPVAAIPAGLANIAASVMEIVQSVPLLSRDQVKLALNDNICSENAIRSLIDNEPQSLALSLNTYRRGQ